MLEGYIFSLTGFLRRQHEESLYKRCEDSFLSFISRLPALPRLGAGTMHEKFFSPYLFLAAFILFLGLSDHALSLIGLVGIILACAFFLFGMKATLVTIPRISQSFFWPLAIVCLLSPLLLLYDWNTFQKFTIIPYFLLFLTGRYRRELSLLSIVLWVFIFKMGWWAVSSPFLIVSLYFCAKEFSSDFFERNASSILFVLFVAGTFFFFCDITLVFLKTGNIPLLSEESRAALDPTFTMLSHLLPLSCVLAASMGKRTGTILLFVFCALAMGILGFRTQVVFLFLAVTIASSTGKITSKVETYASLILVGAVGLALTGLRSLILETRIGIIEAIRLRAGLTLDIYDMMAALGGMMGYTRGQVYISAIPGFARLMPNIAWAPRRMVAEFVGMRGSATSTILGPVAVDFGLVGIALFMIFLGYLLARLYQLNTRGGIHTMLYSSCLAYALIGIETGLVDIEVLSLFVFSFLFIQLSPKKLSDGYSYNQDA
jgi:oligosaccharide repeat unit polymerase